MGNGWSNQAVRRLIVEVGADFSGLFFYDPAVGLGNLVGSWAVLPGTDPYGNAYPGGIGVLGSNGTLGNLGSAGLAFTTTNPNVDLPSLITANQVGALASAFDEFDFEGPRDSTNTEQWFVTLRSASQDGTQRAQAIIRLHQGAQTINALLCDFAGAHLLGTTTAVQPGTGTSTIQAVAETWHTATVTNVNWTGTGTAQPLRYRKQADGTVRLDGELLTTGAGPWPANTTLAVLGTGYAPTQNSPFITRSDIAVAAGQDTVNVLAAGPASVQNGQAFTAAGQRLFFNGVTYPVD